ncbi:MAG: malonyl-CoA synthase [Burkholderiales bacterium]|nr:malonyl-CoA synthase [Burkholderiales bacterium]
MNGNLYALFESRFPADRESVLLEDEHGRRYTFNDLDAATARLAACLSGIGVKPGDRVAAQIEKSPQGLFLYLACLRAGFVWLPLNTAYQSAEVEYFLGNAEPAAVIAQTKAMPWMAPLCAKLGIGNLLTLDEAGAGTLMEAAQDAPATFAVVQREDNDLAAILYTSGTTGRSKGAMITHRNLASNALALHQTWGFRPGDVLLHTLPLFHVHGLFVACHCALLNGGRMIFHSRFDAIAVMRALPRATVFMGVPTYYVRLLSEAAFGPTQTANVRLFISGSAPLLMETFESFKARTGQVILERYGMTETGMITSNPLEGERKAGTVGPPLPGVSVRIVGADMQTLPAGEVGEILVKGDNVLPGYWRMPEKNAEEFTPDGYFKTGDVGRIDADGYVSIVGRSKDLVITGGYNVYPKEIELLLDEMPGVAESAVIGVPHPDFGEAVTAVVVQKPGAAPIVEADVIAELKTQLANFKVPKRVHVVSDLPRNAMGKVQKNVLRQQYGKT